MQGPQLARTQRVVAWSSPVICEGSSADSSHRTIGGETCHIDCIGGDDDDVDSKGVSR